MTCKNKWPCCWCYHRHNHRHQRCNGGPILVPPRGRRIVPTASFPLPLVPPPPPGLDPQLGAAVPGGQVTAAVIVVVAAASAGAEAVPSPPSSSSLLSSPSSSIDAVRAMAAPVSSDAGPPGGDPWGPMGPPAGPPGGPLSGPNQGSALVGRRCAQYVLELILKDDRLQPISPPIKEEGREERRSSICVLPCRLLLLLPVFLLLAGDTLSLLLALSASLAIRYSHASLAAFSVLSSQSASSRTTAQKY